MTAPVNTEVHNYPAVEDGIADVPVIVKEAKAGYKSTEFWIAILGALALQTDTIHLPEKYGGSSVGTILLGVVYILSRGIAKNGVPDVVAVDEGV